VLSTTLVEGCVWLSSRGVLGGFGCSVGFVAVGV